MASSSSFVDFGPEEFDHDIEDDDDWIVCPVCFKVVWSYEYSKDSECCIACDDDLTS